MAQEESKKQPNNYFTVFANYVDDQLHGDWKKFDENNVLIENGFYNNGFGTGEWIVLSGSEKFKIRYENDSIYKGIQCYNEEDKPVSKWYRYNKDSTFYEYRECHPNHQLEEIFTYNNGFGKWEAFFENGQLKSKGNLIGFHKEGRSEKDGEWSFFYENGQLNSSGTYKHGNRIGIWNYYNKDGKLEKSVNESFQ